MSLAQHLPSARLPPRRRQVLPTAAVTAASAGVATVLARVDPNQPGHYPGCPFLLVSGLYCPGCGSLRAVHDLLHANLADALARNPLAVVAIPFLLYALGAAWARALGRRPPSLTSVPAPVIWGGLVVVLAFGVLRNLPGWSWLSPA